MIKILRPGEDIIDVLTGDIEYLKSVCYYTHKMNKEDGVRPELKYKEDSVECRISSQEIDSNFLEGQLICEIEMEAEDAGFEDGYYNEIFKDEMPVWIKK